MEAQLVKKWPDYIRDDPRAWIEEVVSRYGEDSGVKILTDLILNGAKPVKRVGENGRKSRDTGMLPWNPHLIIVLDQILNRKKQDFHPKFQRRSPTKPHD